MGYPHYSNDCDEFHGLVRDFTNYSPWRQLPELNRSAGGGSIARVIAQRATRPEIVTLCGSTKFMEDFLAEQRQLTLEGAIVISVGLFGHMENEYVPASLDLGTDDNPSDLKIMLDELHFRKVELADRIHVINKGGYIGTSTRNEVAHAEKLGKKITFMEAVGLRGSHR